MRLAPSLSLLMLLACRGGPFQGTPDLVCDAEACAATCAGPEATLSPGVPPDALALSEREWSIFSDELEDYRQGIRPWDDRGVGVCGGAACETFLGLTPGLLPPGNWRVRANLRVPRLGQQVWRVFFRETCEMVLQAGEPGASRTTEDRNQQFEVTWQSETRGALLDALTPITSPDPKAHRLCGWDITANGPGGVTQRWEGAYEVPYIGEVQAAARAQASEEASAGAAATPVATPPAPQATPPRPPRDAQVPEAPTPP